MAKRTLIKSCETFPGQIVQNRENSASCHIPKSLIGIHLYFGKLLDFIRLFSRIRFSLFQPGQLKSSFMMTFFKTEPDILETQQLVKQQIMDLGSALFFTENESILKLPVHVINNVQVDDEHQIWFLIQRPTQALSEFDAELPAKLDFFKKGMPYQMKVKGIASIVDDAAKVNALAGNGNNAGLVAVKVIISSTEYIETVAKPAQNWLQQSLSHLFSAQ